MNTTPKSQTPNTRLIRAAIVGTGFIADYHALAIRGAEGVELVSVCDPNLKSAQAFAAKWRVPGVFDSLDLMLKNQQLDFVHVLAPPDLHYQLAKAALQTGAHVLIEKPMCTSAQLADDLCNFARENGLHLGVGHNMLYSDPYRRLRDLVRAGTLAHLAT